MAQRLFTNATGSNSIKNAFATLGASPSNVLLASPFFSDSETVADLVRAGSRVKLLVRLGPATKATELERVRSLDGIQIRFFTSRKFHSKLYIFGHTGALVGSANLTAAGLISNQELAMEIDPSDPRFDELVSVFNRYWNEAEVFTAELSARYKQLDAQHKVKKDPLEVEVLSVFGDIAPTGVQVGGAARKKEDVFISDYRRIYQEFLDAFGVVKARYLDAGRRKKTEEVVPLRIEIDAYFSFIRQRFTAGESYQTEPILAGDELHKKIDEHLDEWFREDWRYLENEVPVHYAKISTTLASPERIARASAEELYDAMLCCHSINDRFRFFKGGKPTQRKDFLQDNSEARIRNFLAYLLHGPGDYVERMAECIFGDEYKLEHVARSGVQELLGWVNREEVPICNGRTVKALRYLGFDVYVFA